jgi:hypothetical protein
LVAALLLKSESVFWLLEKLDSSEKQNPVINTLAQSVDFLSMIIVTPMT